MVLIAINSVLIMKENIMFLEEWIDYHLNLGYDKIYLYDNSKVQKKSNYDMNNPHLIPQKTNKYGICYDDVVTLTNEEILEIIENIKNKYLDNVCVIEWSPKDENGLVCYNQSEAYYDCLERLKRDNIDWCTNIDIDEFVIINNGKIDNIKEYINNLDKNITNIQMSQIRFDSRFNNLDKLILTIDKSELYELDKNHSTKYTFKVEAICTLKVHTCKTIGKFFFPDINELCFNHYKINFSNPWNKFKIIKSNINENILKRIQNNSKYYFINKFKKNIY